jgi:hypothetical protein
MAMDEAPDIREPDPCSLKLILMVKTLEHAKEFVLVFRIETDTVITDKKYKLFFFRNATDFDFGPGPGPCKLQGIRKKIHEHQAKH